ncbi:hypothetical protein CC1G_03469 [Coprinopsis cinerea okayama7|uniref:Cupredoxin n=1 Tax=Coprinopsis cinerea (strain Okayama-7 / 130 / ATCC MYA-4618 / FGSC 9003) TaxID=240176 RepID=A8NQU8_COPC7|nr:hypothetical protein CC1G_03469 [Coprinopsis cinerea okayama7\|eukprot:XP_001835687.2 hypothetical protein CC1G_03469 [Coprinopsis cinerea okayama7\
MVPTPFAILLLATISQAQTTHMIVVGLEGSFFNPPTVSARPGDTITFVFAGEAHIVTQSTFEEPCTPLPGGFNSGFAGWERNRSSGPPTWNLYVEDATDPIWFFCQANRPASHCSACMVGAINPPSQGRYAEFANLAKTVSVVPSEASRPSLTGLGAFATGPPAISSSITAPSLTSEPNLAPSAFSDDAHMGTSSELGSSIASPPQSTTPTSGIPTESISVIVGGAVGGALGVLIIIASMFLCIRHQRLAQERYLATLSARVEKERELDVHPFTYGVGGASRQSERQSSNLNVAQGGLSGAIPLQPLRRRATTIGSSSTVGTIASTAPITSNLEPNPSPTSNESHTSDRITDGFRFPVPQPIPTGKGAAFTPPHRSSRRTERGTGSDTVSLLYPIRTASQSLPDDPFSRQRCLHVSNPSPSPHRSTLGVTPEQYWSAQMGGKGADAPRYPFGYSSSPPNYLAATAGNGSQGWVADQGRQHL